MPQPTRRVGPAVALAVASLLAGCSGSGVRRSSSLAPPATTLPPATAAVPVTASPDSVGPASSALATVPFEPCGAARRPVAGQPVDVPDPAYREVAAPSGGGRIEAFRHRPGAVSGEPAWYLARRSDRGGLQISVLDPAFGPLTTVELADGADGADGAGDADPYATDFAVDPDSGDLYVVRRQLVERRTIEGVLVWSRGLDAPVSGAVYSFGTGADARVGVVVAEADGTTHSRVYNADGRSFPDLPIAADDVRVATAHRDELVAVSPSELSVYDAAGSELLFRMDDRLGDGAASLRLTGANLLPDGSLVVTSSSDRSVALFSPAGDALGRIGADRNAGNPLQYVSDASPVEVVDGVVHYVGGAPYSGPNSVVAMPAEMLAALASRDGTIERLGFGATTQVEAPYGHFVAGGTPVVTALFSDWWSVSAGELAGSYTVRSAADVRAGRAGTAGTFTVPSEPDADGVMRVTLTGLPTEPGAYDVSVTLHRGGSVVGAECVRYSMGAPGSAFDPASLEQERPDLRGVQLAAMLGQRLYRSSYRLADCLPKDATGVDDTTTVVCPPDLIADVDAAVEAAAAIGVTYEVQLGEGGPLELDAVADGQWGRLVSGMVAALPGVDVWECWNEPNNNSFDSMAQYVERALRPCFAGVKAVEPGDLVVGGSVLGVSLGAWDELIEAGGLAYLDVAATHPYTGHNRSFEEQGLVRPEAVLPGSRPGALERLIERLDAADFTGEVWVTEHGFWNEGPGSYYTQGDKLVRRTVLQHSIGIDRSYLFYLDGAFPVDGLRWGLLTDVVTPGAIAVATFGQVVGAARFDSWLVVEAPHVYAARYLDPAGESTTVVAWTDDLRLPVVVSSTGGEPIEVIDAAGTRRTVDSGGSMELSGSPVYLSAPTDVSLVPAAPFGPDLTDADGVTAEASSTHRCAGTELDASRAIDGVADADDRGGNCDRGGMSLWEPASPDEEATLTISLPSPTPVDRVFFAGKGLGSVEVGLRDVVVEIADPDGRFVEVGRVTDAFFDRSHLVGFDAVTTTAVRLRVSRVNFSGYRDGTKPSFWDDATRGVGGIYEVELYGPSG